MKFFNKVICSVILSGVCLVGNILPAKAIQFDAASAISATVNTATEIANSISETISVPAAIPTATSISTPSATPAVAATNTPLVIPAATATSAPSATPSTSIIPIPTTAPEPIPVVAPITSVVPKTICIIGDSRTCSLLVTLSQDSTWKRICIDTNLDTMTSRAVFVKGNLNVVICGQAKGCYQAGSFDHTFSEVIGLFSSVKELKDVKEVTFFDWFGINDAWAYDKKAAAGYMKADAQIPVIFEQCSKVYHATAGPINSEGNVWSYCDNKAIKKFNSGFVSNKDVEVLDVYDYLMKAGYEAPLTEKDPTGLHYDMTTDTKVLNYFINQVLKDLVAEEE